MQFPNHNPAGTVEKDRFHTGDGHNSFQFFKRADSISYGFKEFHFDPKQGPRADY